MNAWVLVAILAGFGLTLMALVFRERREDRVPFVIGCVSTAAAVVTAVLIWQQT